MSEYPRRNDTLRNTPAEMAIREATRAVEAAGADPRLTDAVVLLQHARDDGHAMSAMRQVHVDYADPEDYRLVLWELGCAWGAGCLSAHQDAVRHLAIAVLSERRYVPHYEQSRREWFGFYEAQL